MTDILQGRSIDKMSPPELRRALRDAIHALTPEPVTLEVQNLTLNPAGSGVTTADRERAKDAIYIDAAELQKRIHALGHSRELTIARMKIDSAVGWVDQHLKQFP